MALYQGKAFSPQTTIAADIGAADTVIQLSNIDALPDAPNYATIGTDEEGETIFYAAKTSDSLSGCVRGVEGTAASWAAGSIIARNFTAKDWNDGIAAINAAGVIPLYLATGVGNPPVQMYNITAPEIDENNIPVGTTIMIIVDKPARAASVYQSPRLRINNGGTNTISAMELLSQESGNIYDYYTNFAPYPTGYITPGGTYTLKYLKYNFSGYEHDVWMICNVRDGSKVDLDSGTANNLALKDTKNNLRDGQAVGVISVIGYGSPLLGLDGDTAYYTQQAIDNGAIVYYDLSVTPIAVWIGIKNNNTSARWTNGGITDITDVTPTPIT